MSVPALADDAVIAPPPSVRVQRYPRTLVVGAVLLLGHALVATTGRWWAPESPTKILVGPPFDGPSRQHLLGTDNFGRDVFSRVVSGESAMFSEALLAAGLAVIVGSMLAMLLAYVRGPWETGAMRLTEIAMSVPSIILSMLILSALGNSSSLLIGTVAVLFVPPVMTVIRAAALDVVTQDYVIHARLRGESRWSIVVREVLPNIASNIAVEFSLRAGFAAILISGLSFLGFGAAPPAPDWGLMINQGQAYFTTAPWTALAPSIALASLVVGLSLFTEGLIDKLGPNLAAAK